MAQAALLLMGEGEAFFQGERLPGTARRPSGAETDPDRRVVLAGETSRDAGADFTPADLRHVQQVFEGIAPLLAEARPPGY